MPSWMAYTKLSVSAVLKRVESLVDLIEKLSSLDLLHHPAAVGGDFSFRARFDDRTGLNEPHLVSPFSAVYDNWFRDRVQGAFSPNML